MVNGSIFFLFRIGQSRSHQKTVIIAYHTIVLDDVRLFFCIYHFSRESERPLEHFITKDYDPALANLGFPFLLLCEGTRKKRFNPGLLPPFLLNFIFPEVSRFSVGAAETFRTDEDDAEARTGPNSSSDYKDGMPVFGSN